jgi:hypothetical protein
MAEIGRQMVLLSGREGEEALKRAARTDVMRKRQITQQLADGREIERRAHEIAREDRINEAARRKAKLYGGDLA